MEASDFFTEALAKIETGVVPQDPDAPTLHKYRLRPSEEAAILAKLYECPPKPWGIKINLGGLFLGEAKCCTIGRKLILNTTVTYLDLSFCDMQENGSVEFFSCIRRNRTLRHLNLNGNYIGDKGAEAAASCLPQLESLHISSNSITDTGALAIIKALPLSKRIKHLNLRNNSITLEVIKQLISCLEPSESTAELPDKLGVVVDEITLQIKEGENIEDPEESTTNDSLQALWIDGNCDIPIEWTERLNKILASRFPKPPVPTKRKGKKKSRNK